MLGWPLATFKTHRTRNELLKRNTGRGRAAEFNFGDIMAAHVAKRLIEMKLQAPAACRIANNLSPLSKFVMGEPIQVFLRDGEISYTGNPDEDISILIPLEKIGWQVAEYFLAGIAAEYGVAAAREAQARFRQQVAELRGE
ncbi:hypothetical protein LA6_001181 [Marinibacterium anthonyi]|nr:hypothetical protein LA6_001181 [Marinibacterium anthonyi]